MAGDKLCRSFHCSGEEAIGGMAVRIELHHLVIERHVGSLAGKDIARIEQPELRGID